MRTDHNWRTFARTLERELAEARELNLSDDSDIIVGSCNCLTKTPVIQHHKRGCKYRLIVERNEAREQRDRLADCLIHLKDKDWFTDDSIHRDVVCELNADKVRKALAAVNAS